ncbi:MAG TPA: DUF3006 domain-containing protein [Candidatus Aphodovivens avicola]|nr:DUF3006 domain-containing protein [Candidatus Aphodovivens avicola]
MRKVTIDRLEGGFAVCEESDGTMSDIPVSDLPAEAAEGSVLLESDGAWIIDKNEERERRDRIRRKMNRLFKD